MGERGTRATEIADRITKVREANGIGVRRLTKLVSDHIVGLGLDPYGTSYGTIRSYTTGAVLKPRRDVLDAIASVLGVRPDWLNTGKGYPTDHDEELAVAQAVEVEWLGDDWGLLADLYHRIRQNCLLPNMSPAVRALFWEAHHRLGASSLVEGDEDALYEIAEWIDLWVQEPTHWYEGLTLTEPQILNYYVGALNALALLGSMAPRASVSAIFPTPKEQE
jgi:transcriptional regulator with XRE-family HTH domain